jgi:hypothetical protein
LGKADTAGAGDVASVLNAIERLQAQKPADGEAMH